MFLKEVGSEDEGQDDKHSSESGFEGLTKISSVALCWAHLLSIELEWSNSTPIRLLP